MADGDSFPPSLCQEVQPPSLPTWDTSEAHTVLQTAVLLPSCGMHSNSDFLLLKLFNTMLFVICYIINIRQGAELISKDIINSEVLSVFLYLFFQARVVFYYANYLDISMLHVFWSVLDMF